MVTVTVRKLVLHVKNCIENSTSFIQKLIRNYQKVRAPTPTTKKNATKKKAASKTVEKKKKAPPKPKKMTVKKAKKKKRILKYLVFKYL